MPALAGRTVSVLIWTTTPWTIPSNLAIAFHPELRLRRLRRRDGRREGRHRRRSAGVACRRSSRPAVRRADRAHGRAPLWSAFGSGIRCTTAIRWPCSATTSRSRPAPARCTRRRGMAPTTSTPACRYGLEIYAPIGPGGHFLDTVGLFGGKRVFDANPNVERALKERGRLWHRETFSHQYPHCWRCHNPVIFLATSQWFIRLDEVRAERRTSDEIRRCDRRRSPPSTTT